MLQRFRISQPCQTYRYIVSPIRPLIPRSSQRSKLCPTLPSAVNDEVLIQRCRKQHSCQEEYLGRVEEAKRPIPHEMPWVLGCFRFIFSNVQDEKGDQGAEGSREANHTDTRADIVRVVPGAGWVWARRRKGIQRSHVDNAVKHLEKVSAFAKNAIFFLGVTCHTRNMNMQVIEVEV